MPMPRRANEVGSGTEDPIAAVTIVVPPKLSSGVAAFAANVTEISFTKANGVTKGVSGVSGAVEESLFADGPVDRSVKTADGFVNAPVFVPSYQLWNAVLSPAVVFVNVVDAEVCI